MTLPRVNALMEYWLENPPLHLMIKAFMSIKGSGKKAPINQNNSCDLLGMLAQGGVAPGGQSPLDTLMAPFLDKAKDG